jgi:serine/threonine protein kinase/tetratricopeptide (TPR) repeat protein
MREPLTSARVVQLAAAVADGQCPDWNAAESDAENEEERILIGHLRSASVIGHGRASLYTSSLGAEVLGARWSAPSGATWGSLRIVEKVGRGRFGDVYRAWDPTLDREVALKLLRPRSSLLASDDSEIVAEGRMMARMRHPNVATIYGAQTIEGVTGLWMEFVRGRTLEEELVARGAFSADDLVHVAIELCHALQAIHDSGLVHRDIKPQNVMRDDTGRIVLGDFGTGRELHSIRSELAGTPVYIAPEIFNGSVATPRSDIYSLGVLLYHLATGSFPVRATSIDAFRDAHQHGSRTLLRDARPDLPRDLASAIERGSAADPEVRFENVSQFLLALEQYAGSVGRLDSHRRSMVLAAVLFISLIVSGSWWLFAPKTAAPLSPQWVLVSEFDNATSDDRLSNVLGLALERELTQSSALSVVPHERVVDTLRLMRRDPGARIDATTAREICLRDGQIGVFVTGRVDRVRSGYELDVAAKNAETGTSIARASLEVSGLDDVVDGVRSVASRIRRALGESGKQVEADMRLEQVTTGSLEALRVYTRGLSFINERRAAAAELPLRDAIRLDPNFSSSYIMLAYSLRNQLRPADEYVPLALRALQQSDSLPSREKYFIIGSYYTFIGENDKAIAAYEALVREHPTDYWGLNNLMNRYRESGRYREEIPLIPRYAALRPNDYETTVTAAQLSVMDAGDIVQARRLVDPAASLGRPNTPDADGDMAWTAIFPVFELWVNHRVGEAAARLDATTGDVGTNDAMAVAIGRMNLALGRVSAAENAFRTMSISAGREEMLAAAALARGNLESARDMIRADTNLLDPRRHGPVITFGKDTFILWVMLRAGLIKEAEAYVRLGFFDKDPTRWMNAELMAARGELDAAIPLLDEAIRKLAPGNAQTLMAIETLGTRLIDRGDLWAARRVLLSAGTLSTTYHSSGSRGYIWLRVRALLLNVERRLGHMREATEIQYELDQLLQVADPDCRNTLQGLSDRP